MKISEWCLGVVKVLFGSSEEASYILLFKNNICRQSLSCGCVCWDNKYYNSCMFVCHL